jgi:membrane protein implicated in regulation of membrane protease activity
MKNPVVKYFLLRLGLFALVLAILLAIVKDPLQAAVFAAVISFALSVIFLRKARDGMSTHLYERSQAKKSGKLDAANDVENDLLDGKSE